MQKEVNSMPLQQGEQKYQNKSINIEKFTVTTLYIQQNVTKKYVKVGTKKKPKDP